MSYFPPLLPHLEDIESPNVLRKLARSHQALAELKGLSAAIPNQSILISTLSLQEARDSSAVENIVTTQDELFQSDSRAEIFASSAAREVYYYANALQAGFERVRQTGLLTNSDINEIQTCIKKNKAGFRRLPGTTLKNEASGEVIYTPPQHPDEIERLMANLERFINDDRFCDWDPLTKMAVVHHQFESIHPFYDGNGRTGRIINILYLVQQGLLDIPVLYLSRYINQDKSEYYRQIQIVRDEGTWEEWLLYMLEGVEQTSRQTIVIVQGIRDLMQHHKQVLRDKLPKIYSQDLINNLFRQPYTKIDFVIRDLNVHRNTAARYLDQIESIGLVSKHRVGKDNYYINEDLYQLLLGVGQSAR